MAVYGKIENYEFDMNWDEYIERLEHFFTANEIEDADKMKSILLTVCGQKMYGLIRNLTSPNKPADKTYAELKTLIAQHLKPKPLAIAERFRFYQRNQGKQETVSQYIAELRKLSEFCEFGEFLNQALRDRLVCGLSSVGTQRKLLAEDKLDLKKAMDVAISMELAETEARKLKADVQDVHEPEPIHKVTVRNKPCYRCGKTNHIPDKCFYQNSKCHTCHEMGHIRKMCSKKETVEPKKTEEEVKIELCVRKSRVRSF